MSKLGTALGKFPGKTAKVIDEVWSDPNKTVTGKVLEITAVIFTIGIVTSALVVFGGGAAIVSDLSCHGDDFGGAADALEKNTDVLRGQIQRREELLLERKEQADRVDSAARQSLDSSNGFDQVVPLAVQQGANFARYLEEDEQLVSRAERLIEPEKQAFEAYKTTVLREIADKTSQLDLKELKIEKERKAVEDFCRRVNDELEKKMAKLKELKSEVLGFEKEKLGLIAEIKQLGREIERLREITKVRPDQK